MKSIVLLLLYLTLCFCWEENDWHCKRKKLLTPRPHSVSILEFGAVGDGKTLNTIAFENAIFYLKSFADKGGAQLYVPPGRWLTGSINLTSYSTLFLETGAVILGSQDYHHWELVEPLPSYGGGIEVPGWRYSSLITGYNLTDVVITGNNGTIDGQGSVWWDLYDKHHLNHSRPHIMEFVDSSNIVISNLTFLNSPAWSIHPIYCSDVLIENITVHAPPDSPHTCGIVPDSSVSICICNCNVSTGYDAIVLKSGWDEYGIAYARPTANVHMNLLRLQSYSGSGLAFGSEMSGGISKVVVEQVNLKDCSIGIELKTTRGRGGYMEDIIVLKVEMQNVYVALKATGMFGFHPDEGYDPDALPLVRGITFSDVIGSNIMTAGSFSGIYESPFIWFILSNVTFHITATDPSAVWFCDDIFGASEHVLPNPCPELQILPLYNSSFSILNTVKQVRVQ